MNATETIKFSVQSNAREYSDAIAQYAVDTGKAISAALLREGPDFTMELFRQFKAITPKPVSIADAAKARHFRMGRKGNEFAAAMDGLSVKARNAAVAAMGGDKSDLFMVGSNGQIEPVRFSVKRKWQRNHTYLWKYKVIHYKKGRGMRASQLDDGLVNEAIGGLRRGEGNAGTTPAGNPVAPSGVVRLNQRAAATYYEILFREKGTHGGFMAIQWLYKTWKKPPQFDASTGNTQLLADRKPPELVNRTGSGKPTGKVEFETGAFGGVENIVLTGMVPGTALEMEKHSILPKVATARIAALAKAIQQHHKKVASKYKLN